MKLYNFFRSSASYRGRIAIALKGLSYDYASIVPAAYVGQTVSVQESTEHYEIFHRARLIARHPKAARYSVVMEPAHYAGLLRAGGRPSPGSPPRFDPYFGGFGEVMVRDLALYEATIIAAIPLCEKGLFRTLHHGSG
jgi:hypothetical protein